MVTGEYTQLNMFTDDEYFWGMAINFDVCTAYYYDQGNPAYHRFYCGDQTCEYCWAIGYMLADSHYRLNQLISYEKFIELFPNGDYEYYELLLSHYPSSSISQSVDNDYSDDNESVDDYTYGYNPNDCQLGDHDINFENLEVVGAGCSGVVLSDGKVAIKIGSVDASQYKRMLEGASYGFCVPVYSYKPNIELDSRIVDAIKDADISCNGWSANGSNYLNYSNGTYYADMLVMALAEPFLSTDVDQDTDEFQHACNIALRVKEEYAAKSSVYWRDAHGYNIGLYNGAVVILDI